MKASDIQIQFDTFTLEQSAFSEQGARWEAITLINAAEGLPVFDLPLIGLDLSGMPFKISNVRDVVNHTKRILETRLKYPVILDDLGFICDGWHRVAKALLKGRTTIKAVRLVEMPPPDEIFDNE